jgi:hypothetical protein
MASNGAPGTAQDRLLGAAMIIGPLLLFVSTVAYTAGETADTHRTVVEGRDNRRAVRKRPAPILVGRLAVHDEPGRHRHIAVKPGVQQRLDRHGPIPDGQGQRQVREVLTLDPG